MKYEEMSDEQLMLLVEYEDDGDAYEELHSRHSGMSMIICKKCARNLVDAEDLNQEVWAKVWRRRETFRDDGVFKAWLMVITPSICLGWIKKQKRMIRVIINENLEEETLEQWLDRLSNQAQELYRRNDHSEAIRRVWNRLSAEDRKLLRQVYVDELSQKDMAKERGISIPTLKKRFREQLLPVRERFRLNLLEEGIQVGDPNAPVSATEEETQVEREHSPNQSEEIED